MIWRLRVSGVLLIGATASAPAHAQADAALARARRILAAHPLIDGHNDLPYVIRENAKAPGNVDAYDLRTRSSGDADLERLREARVIPNSVSRAWCRAPGP